MAVASMEDSKLVKLEPDVADEEDLDEDAGDLEFYDKTEPNDPLGTVYMAKVPKFVWDAWNSIDDDAEIRIGTIRTWEEATSEGPKRVCVHAT